MKKYMPFNGLRWSRDSGSALYDIPQTAVFGRAGGGILKLLPFVFRSVFLAVPFRVCYVLVKHE